MDFSTSKSSLFFPMHPSSIVPPPIFDTERILEVDYLKGILITLMVLFHLSWFSTYYLNATQYVYIFHMSGFIILSGFFANPGKSPCQFLKNLLGILIPYLIFESLYYLTLSNLPTSIPTSNRLTPSFAEFWKTLLLHPAGTYWYLYFLVICLGVYYPISQIPRLSPPSKLAITATLLATISWFNPSFKLPHVCYFLLGAFFRMTGLSILKCLSPTLLSFAPIVLIYFLYPLPARTSIPGLFLCILTLSFLLKTYDFNIKAIRKFFIYLGRNSLSIVIFSPIFTLLCKPLGPILSFDSSRLCFAGLSLMLVLLFCLGTTKLCDSLGWSTLLFFKKKMYVPMTDVR